MLISRLKLKNWRNFTDVDVALQQRQFIVGPNASGKSNLLDVFRFLRDIAKPRGGGLQEAIAKRGGLSKIRCLSARQGPGIEVTVDMTDSESDETPKWRYELGVKQETRGYRQPYVSHERVWREGREILNRPMKDDNKDKERLKQTHLEQVNNNFIFRDIVQYLDKITYLHLVPQLLRHSDSIQGRILEDDPFGQGFLEKIAMAAESTRKFRLRKIEECIKIAVPRLKEIEFERDETGRPHLVARYSHWRSRDALQQEDQFSDGTLRLMALVWSLLDGDSTLLLEEPEISLHSAIVDGLAGFFYRAQKTQKKKKRQVIISTHSSDILSDKGISPEEVLLLEPTNEGTKVTACGKLSDVNALLQAGVSIGEAVRNRTSPGDKQQLSLPI